MIEAQRNPKTKAPKREKKRDIRMLPSGQTPGSSPVFMEYPDPEPVGNLLRHTPINPRRSPPKNPGRIAIVGQ